MDTEASWQPELEAACRDRNEVSCADKTVALEAAIHSTMDHG